ncbi:MAG: hypothetical protein NTX87_13520 [Planctomycetota bacterium]|nr:hypothetical protein [Planctomycetota bacterium]
MPQALVNSLRRIRRRLLLVRAAEAGLLGAIAAAPVAAAVTGVRILRPESVPLAAAHPALALALVACGFVLAMLVRLAMGVSLRQAALAADRAANLKERLATALEVLGQSPPASERVACPARRWLGMSQAQSGKHAQAKSSLGMPPGRGILDERLVEQATYEAAKLDVARLPLARTAGRSVRVLLVAVLVLVMAAFIPPVGGPPVGRQEADRAAETLRRAAAAATESIHPDIRSQISRAAQALARPGIRRAGADQATAAVFDAAARIEQARQATLDELKKVENPEIQEMARAAAGGDMGQAVSQASKAADRLLGTPGAGAATEADRRRVADGLTGAAPTALREHLPELAAQLRACAEAMRRADAEAVRRALHDLAIRMTQDIGERPGAGPRDLMAAVAEARRAMGLPDLPAPDAGGGAMQGRGYPAASAAGSQPPGTAAAPGGAPEVEAMPADAADVRPEDREVVRRYFGG